MKLNSITGLRIAGIIFSAGALGMIVFTPDNPTWLSGVSFLFCAALAVLTFYRADQLEEKAASENHDPETIGALKKEVTQSGNK